MENSILSLTLADWAKRVGPDGKISGIVELLRQRNDILEDMLLMEGNLPTGHRVTVRTGLAEAYWKIINQGVPLSKTETAQVDEGSGIMEAWSEVDCDLAELNGNTPQFRLSEASGFVQGLNNQMAQTLFHGNASINKEQFNGLSVRYSSLTGAESGKNIIDAGGTGNDNTSIWLVTWHDQATCGIFPKGSKAGLNHEDKGKKTIETAGGTAEGRRLDVYQSKWQWKLGLVVKDWNYNIRIANISRATLKSGTGAAKLNELMIQAMHTIPDLNLGKMCFYMNRAAMFRLDIQRLKDVAGAGMQYAEVDGKWMPTFRGIPIRKVDALNVNEARVV